MEDLVWDIIAPDGASFRVTLSPPGTLLGRGPIAALFDRRWRVVVVDIPHEGYVGEAGYQAIAESMRRHYAEACRDEPDARRRAATLSQQLGLRGWAPSEWTDERSR